MGKALKEILNKFEKSGFKISFLQMPVHEKFCSLFRLYYFINRKNYGPTKIRSAQGFSRASYHKTNEIILWFMLLFSPFC